ncbi:MAG: TrkH family potassium uptake protein [Planctomycetota bacterium]
MNNLRLVARLLGRFVLFFGLLGLPCAAMAMFEPGDGRVDGRAGLVAMAVTSLVLGLILVLLGRRTTTELYRRESLLVVALAWLSAGWIGGVPYWMSGAVVSPIDGFFECVSGLTTCGATVLGVGDQAAIHDLPASLHLWRSLTQWIGGLGIILLFVVLLPALGIAPGSLVESESVGISDPRVRPRMVQRGRVLLRVYLVLTASAFVLLWLVGGLTPFQALCHSMTTLSTGGFSTEDASIAGFQSVVVEIILIFVMFLAATNFLLLREAVFGGREGLIKWLRDGEFRAYLAMLVGSITVASLVLWWGATVVPDPAGPPGAVRDYGSFVTCLRDCAFNLTSLMTCTGFASANFQCWPVPIVVLLLAMMFTGGSMGSTAGGIKVMRVVVLTRVCLHKLRSFVRPRSIEHVKLDGHVLEPRELSGVLAIVLIFGLAVLFGAFLVSLDSRLDFLSSLSLCVSSASCVGPGITAVVPGGGGFVVANAGSIDVGPFGSCGLLLPFTKLVLAVLMIFGRLEFLALLCLFTPGFWRRR